MTIMEQTIVLTIQYDPIEAGPPEGWDWPTLIDHPSDMVNVSALNRPEVSGGEAR